MSEKIKISELRNGSKSGDNMKWERYIPYALKSSLVKNIARDSLIVIDGITKVNYCLVDLMLDIAMVKFYTNIDDVEFNEGDEIDDSISGNYDFLKNSYIEEIIEFANKDYSYLKEKIYKTLKQEVSQLNSIEKLVQAQLIRFVDKATELMNEKTIKNICTHAVKQINKIDKNLLTENSGLIKTVIDTLKNKEVAE